MTRSEILELRDRVPRMDRDQLKAWFPQIYAMLPTHMLNGFIDGTGVNSDEWEFFMEPATRRWFSVGPNGHTYQLGWREQP